MKKEVRELFKTLTFGIEIECTNLDKEEINNEFCHRIKEKYGGYDDSGYAYTTVDKKDWCFVHDQSIYSFDSGNRDYTTSETTECVTPPLRLNEFEKVKVLCDAINALGGVSSAEYNAGVHIHIGYDDVGFTNKMLRNLWWDVAGHQGLFYSMVKTSRSRAVRWAKKFDRRYVKQFTDENKIGEYWYGIEHDTYSLARARCYSDEDIIESYNCEKYDETRYHLLNLHAFFRQRTVEYRLFEFKEYIDANALYNWVKLAMAITSKAILADKANIAMPSAFACGNDRYAAMQWLKSMGYPELYGDLELNTILNGDVNNRYGESGLEYKMKIVPSII